MAGGIDLGQAAFDFVDEIERMTDRRLVADRLDRELKKFGFHAWLITGLPDPGGRIEPLMMLSGWSDEWTALYTKSNYVQNDPVVAHCFRSTAPFDWSEATYDYTSNPKAEEIMNRASDFGMNRGFCVPIHTSEGFQAVVTMAGDVVELEGHSRRALQFMALCAQGKAIELCERRKFPKLQILTKREREVLQWTAVGKTAWEISQILHIAEQTVVSHVKSAAEKLDTPNRIATVVAALRRREIAL
jgi:LuxR family quorum sensing-dependent transcriptional regulator